VNFLGLEDAEVLVCKASKSGRSKAGDSWLWGSL
jgi:hypothetical protein